jgi:hypothetical protein
MLQLARKELFFRQLITARSVRRQPPGICFAFELRPVCRFPAVTATLFYLHIKDQCRRGENISNKLLILLALRLRVFTAHARPPPESKHIYLRKKQK